jgi:thioredoxin 1
MKHIQNYKEFNLIVQKYKYVIVDVYTDWCGPCKKIAPVFETLSNKYGNNAYFIKVNADLVPEVNVKSLPTFMVFKNKTFLTSIEGVPPNLEEWIVKNIS